MKVHAKSFFAVCRSFFNFFLFFPVVAWCEHAFSCSFRCLCTTDSSDLYSTSGAKHDNPLEASLTANTFAYLSACMFSGPNARPLSWPCDWTSGVVRWRHLGSRDGWLGVWRGKQEVHGRVRLHPSHRLRRIHRRNRLRLCHHQPCHVSCNICLRCYFMSGPMFLPGEQGGVWSWGYGIPYPQVLTSSGGHQSRWYASFWNASLFSL